MGMKEENIRDKKNIPIMVVKQEDAVSCTGQLTAT